MTWEIHEGHFDFEVQATEFDADNGRGWVGAAWSADQNMGDDMAVICDEVNGVNMYWLIDEGENSYGAPVGVSTPLLCKE